MDRGLREMIVPMRRCANVTLFEIDDASTVAAEEFAPTLILNVSWHRPVVVGATTIVRKLS